MLPIIRIALVGPTASVACYRRSACNWYWRVEACGSGFLRRGLNFSTATDISVEKDWKHVLMQKVVTLNTCYDIACLTFQLPHITTGSFHSHRPYWPCPLQGIRFIGTVWLAMDNLYKSLGAPATELWRWCKMQKMGWFGWLESTQDRHRQCHPSIESIRLYIQL